jgi:hypothetical protein
MTDAWYVGASAVRQYLEVTGEPLSFAQATEKLTGLCAQIRQKYDEQPALAPRRLESGAYIYRGPSPERLRFVVAADQAEAGRKPQLISVLPGHSGFRRRS